MPSAVKRLESTSRQVVSMVCLSWEGPLVSLVSGTVPCVSQLVSLSVCLFVCGLPVSKTKGGVSDAGVYVAVCVSICLS